MSGIVSSSCASDDGLLSERSLGSVRNRQLSRDFERYARIVAAFVRLAMVRLHASTLDQANSLFLSPSFLDRLLGVAALRFPTYSNDTNAGGIDALQPPNVATALTKLEYSGQAFSRIHV
ncbi:MAG: hypothetical protein KGL35_29375 [Bradyrhizobium sp.]|nr:hypothetical protein [Bradyrhizobium sp.]